MLHVASVNVHNLTLYKIENMQHSNFTLIQRLNMRSWLQNIFLIWRKAVLTCFICFNFDERALIFTYMLIIMYFILYIVFNFKSNSLQIADILFINIWRSLLIFARIKISSTCYIANILSFMIRSISISWNAFLNISSNYKLKSNRYLLLYVFFYLDVRYL